MGECVIAKEGGGMQEWKAYERANKKTRERAGKSVRRHARAGQSGREEHVEE